jgi:ubiquitin-protein ligase
MLRRLKKELKTVEESYPQVTVKTESQQDGVVVLFTIPGPEGSLYEGSELQLQVTCPKDFPFKPPKFSFVEMGGIYHPIFHKELYIGWLGFNYLKEWSPGMVLIPPYVGKCIELLRYPWITSTTALCEHVAWPMVDGSEPLRFTGEQISLKGIKGTVLYQVWNETDEFVKCAIGKRNLDADKLLSSLLLEQKEFEETKRPLIEEEEKQRAEDHRKLREQTKQNSRNVYQCYKKTLEEISTNPALADYKRIKVTVHHSLVTFQKGSEATLDVYLPGSMSTVGFLAFMYEEIAATNGGSIALDVWQMLKCHVGDSKKYYLSPGRSLEDYGLPFADPDSPESKVVIFLSMIARCDWYCPFDFLHW